MAHHSREDHDHQVPQLTRDEVRARLGDASLLLVDVLAREAFAAGRIPGSLSLPLAQLERRALQVLPDKTQEIVVYCASFT